MPQPSQSHSREARMTAVRSLAMWAGYKAPASWQALKKGREQTAPNDARTA